MEDCLGIFPKPYEVKRDLSTSIGFGFIISMGSVTYFLLPLKNVLSRPQHSFLTSADLQECAVTRAMLENHERVSPWYFAGTHMLALPTLKANWMIASCNQKF